MFRAEADSGEQRKLVTPSPEVLLSNINSFVGKCLTRESTYNVDACQTCHRYAELSATRDFTRTYTNSNWNSASLCANHSANLHPQQ